jgi:hypothetical protein
MGAGAKFSQAVVIIVDILFLICALAITAMGIYGLVTATEIEAKTDLLNDLGVQTTAIIVLCGGFVLVLVAVLGLVAILTKKKGCLGVYIGLLVVLTAIQIAGGVVVLAFGSLVTDNVNTFVADKWYDTKNNNTRSGFQDFFECCGWNTTADFVEPYNDTTACPYTTIACKDKLFDLFDEVMTPLGGALAGFGGLQAVALGLVIYLCCKGDMDDDDLSQLTDF